MPNVLEARMVLYAHHRLLRLRCASLISLTITFFIIVVIAPTFVCEVLWTFVFMRAAIVLEATYDLVDI